MMARTGSNKGDQAEQKRASRARVKGQEAITGIKPTNSGTSGSSLFMSRVQKREFAEIRDQAIRVCGAPAIIDSVRKTPSQSIVVNITSPANYQVELMEMMDACAQGFVWIECYYVPRRPFLREVGGDELNGDGDDDAA